MNWLKVLEAIIIADSFYTLLILQIFYHLPNGTNDGHTAEQIQGHHQTMKPLHNEDRQIFFFQEDSRLPTNAEIDN